MMNSVLLSGPPSMHAKGPVEIDPLQHLTAFTDPHAGIGPRRGPHRAVGIEADTVRPKARGPDAAVRQAAVGRDVERRQLAGEGLGDDQGGIVGCDDHAVGELDAVGHLANRAVGGDQRDKPGDEIRPFPPRDLFASSPSRWTFSRKAMKSKSAPLP